MGWALDVGPVISRLSSGNGAEDDERLGAVDDGLRQAVLRLSQRCAANPGARHVLFDRPFERLVDTPGIDACYALVLQLVEVLVEDGYPQDAPTFETGILVGHGTEGRAGYQLGVLGQHAGSVARGRRLPSSPASGELGLVDLELKEVRRGVDRDEVAVLDEGDGPAHRRLRRDVPDDEARKIAEDNARRVFNFPRL